MLVAQKFKKKYCVICYWYLVHRHKAVGFRWRK